jgi:mannose-1-phosphate guanylyltransferase
VLYAAILAGGSGTRFWPASRKRQPKQFLRSAHCGNYSLLAVSCKRLKGLVPPDRIFIVTGLSQRQICAKQVPGVPRQNIICEPAARGTAAAIGYAAIRLSVSDPEAELVVLPTDLIVSPVNRFIRTLRIGVRIASKGEVLVTIGVKPTFPATGFGYIRRAKKFAGMEGRRVYSVSAFKEKPDADTARRYVSDGNHYWNSGIFIFRASSVLSAIGRHLSALHSGLTRIRASIGTRKEEKVTVREYSALESISIDNGVLEKADNVKVLEADFDWQDVGSWLSLESNLPKDSDGNAVKGDFVSVASRNLVAVSESGVIAAAGVSDLIIVHTPDATLVCGKENAQKVRDIVKRLEEKKLKRYL